jgi:hypothetical protein
VTYHPNAGSGGAGGVPDPHAASHTDGGTDEVTIAEAQVTGLTTALAGKAASSHTHAQADVTNLATDLAAKVPTTRTISTTAPLTGGGDLSANRTFAVSDATTSAKGVVELATDGETAVGVVVQGNDARLADARTPTAHTLVSASHTASGLTAGHVLRATGATTFAFAALQSGDLPTHTHAAADVSSGTFDIARIPTGTTGTTVALGNHNHALSTLTGSLGVAQINATGTPSSSTYLRGDGVWGTPAGGGTAKDTIALGGYNVLRTSARPTTRSCWRAGSGSR